jgi:hypothetical protein
MDLYIPRKWYVNFLYISRLGLVLFRLRIPVKVLLCTCVVLAALPPTGLLPLRTMRLFRLTLVTWMLVVITLASSPLLLSVVSFVPRYFCLTCSQN